MTSKDDSVIWQPQPNGQEAAVDCPIFEVLLTGNRGGGKSDVLLFSYFMHVGRGYGEAWRGVIFRRTYQDLKNIFKAARKWVTRIWPEAKIVQSTPPRIVWPSGEELLFTYAKDMSDYDKHHGWEMPFVGWDELTQWPDLKLYLKLMSICRSDHPDVPLMYRATTNPMGPGHNIIKDRFKLPIMNLHKGNRIGQTICDPVTGLARIAIEVPREDNILIYGGMKNEEYEAKLRADSSNPSQIAAWVHGSWDIVAGGIIDDIWKREHHVVPTPPPRMFAYNGWDIRRCMDWGGAKPFSIQWWARYNDEGAFDYQGHHFGQVTGDRYLIAEWYGSAGHPNEGIRMSAKDMAKGILQREDLWEIKGKVKRGPADHDIVKDVGGQSMKKDMAREGVRWDLADKGPGSRIEGLQQLRKMLKDALPLEDTVREYPGVYICDENKDWLRTVPVLPRSEKNPDDADTDAEDHCYDSSRYYLRHKPKTMRVFKIRGR